MRLIEVNTSEKVTTTFKSDEYTLACVEENGVRRYYFMDKIFTDNQLDQLEALMIQAATWVANKDRAAGLEAP